MLITPKTPGAANLQIFRGDEKLHLTKLDLDNKRLVRVKLGEDGKVLMTAPLGDPTREIAFFHEDATGVRVMGLNHVDPSFPEEMVL